jgi:hypothetical protein
MQAKQKETKKKKKKHKSSWAEEKMLVPWLLFSIGIISSCILTILLFVADEFFSHFRSSLLSLIVIS